MSSRQPTSRRRPGWLAVAALLLAGGCAVPASCAGRVGEAARPDASPGVTAAAARAAANRVAFARLYGYVRYFHPADQAQGVRWEPFVARGMREVAGVTGPDDLVAKLRALFGPLAPTVEVFPAGATPAPSATAAPKGSHVVYWHRTGSGGGNTYYEARRVFAAAGATLPGGLVPGERVEVDLGAGVRCRVPLVLPAHAGRSLPAGPRPASIAPGAEARDRRLADVAIAWNAARHFYPYFEVLGGDWVAVLAPALLAAEAAPDEPAFERALGRMWKHLRDGHAQVARMGSPSYRPDLGWDWVEDRLVVTQVGTTLEGQVALGDEVVAIDGHPTAERLAAEEAVVGGATPGWIRCRALDRLLNGPWDSPLRLDLRSLRGKRTVTVTRKLEPGAAAILAVAPIAEVAPGVFYLSPKRATTSEFEAAMPRLLRANGLIIEVREYPDGDLNLWSSVLPHLTGQTLRSPVFHVPLVLRPDRRVTPTAPITWAVQASAPRIGAKLAFLADGRSISQMETFLDVVRHHRLGDVVGQPSAGANGDIDWVETGGRLFYWSGLEVRKPDGSRSQGIGVVPTVEARRTLADARAGRDTVLERAIAVVSGRR